jgi:hypothetical protein
MTLALTPAQATSLAHLRRAYIGPEQGDDEIIFNRPSLQYAVGMLFPASGDPSGDSPTAGSAGGPSDPEQFVIADVEEGDVEEGDATVPLAEDWRPSSTAVSFVTDSESVLCDFAAATYSPMIDEGPLRWQRQAHTHPNIELSRDASRRELKLGQVRVELGSRWRRYGRGAWLVTVHARLLTRSTGNDRDDIPLMLFQVQLAARPVDGGGILEYDVSKPIDIDKEAQELRLRYRDRKIFAVGHGMAAGWDSDSSGVCSRVFLDPVPAFVVPAVAQTGGESINPLAARALDLAFLASVDTDPDAVLTSLRAFAGDFSAWSEEQQRRAETLGEDAQAIARRSARASERMHRGIMRLADPTATELRTAFALAMTAMRLQMCQAAIVRGEPDPRPTWRPFQLGFLLVALASTVDDSDPEREIVDLIWFPTGGGKTEAYLGLAAIVIFLRRLTAGPAGAGTAVITRYTLRLLTAQQFQRAASLICAMEILRESDPRARGMARFSIGLWIGNEATPGRRVDARHALTRLHKAQSPRDANDFQVTECPWCQVELVPTKRDDEHRRYGARAVGNDVVFWCVNPQCPFSARELPMAVVDEVLYDEPPTILLATVDKFARLQFNARAGRLLGIGTAYRQPSLIIQDELHLLSGPLGTTVAVFDTVIQLLLSRTSKPKIIASTATIRSSKEQVQGLYGRGVALYPPAGLDGDTTFFSRPVESGEGRLYVGLMPQSVSQATALVMAATPLLEIPQALVNLQDINGRLDPYWTLVMYHNSLRELGRSNALVRDDINARLETRSERLGTVLRRVPAASVLELTSRRGPEELPKDLRQLRLSRDESADAIDVVLSSNMLSVGIDVQRLALMLMVGQPKTTAEYIQATSRVGRGAVNGIVVTLFRANRARDRSHFETFRSFHDTLYRSVEPTSVTPWSLSSRDRSLAGAIVSLVRQSFPALAANASAGQFDLNDDSFRADLQRLVDQFLALVARADLDERNDVDEQLWERLRQWSHNAGKARDDHTVFPYEWQPGSEAALVKRFGQPGPGWLVGDSMRSVEPNVAIEVQEPGQELQREEDQA